MLVSDILLSKGHEVATITPDQSIVAALSSLAAHNIGALVVLDRAGALTGIISERDIVRALATTGPLALESTVGDVMTRAVSTCTEETTVTSLMGLMTTKCIRHVPALDDGALAGLIACVLFPRRPRSVKQG